MYSQFPWPTTPYPPLLTRSVRTTPACACVFRGSSVHFGGDRLSRSRIMTREQRIQAVVVLVSMALFYSSFMHNLLGVVSTQWFAWHQKDMESFVVGRMVKSRQDGVLSAAGLLGTCSPIAEKVPFSMDVLRFQYRSYAQGLGCGAYTPYESQIGAQGMPFSLLDRAMPLEAETRLKSLYALTSLLSASLLSVLVLWLWRRIGTLPAITALAFTLCSEWLTVFGRNLWWCLGAFYLPMTAQLWAYRSQHQADAVALRRIAAAAFLAVTAKCILNGYEYMTTVLIMSAVPTVYYCSLAGARAHVFARHLAALAGGSAAAVLLTMAVLCGQIYAATGSDTRGVEHIWSSFEKRSHADPDAYPRVFKASLEADPFTVLKSYLTGSYTTVGTNTGDATGSGLHVPYWFLCLLFTAASAAAILLCRQAPAWNRRILALVAAMWTGFLAPLSWFVIFKEHSFIHTHMNFVVWQMPFTVLGFALCGLVVQQAVALVPRMGSKETSRWAQRRRVG